MTRKHRPDAPLGEVSIEPDVKTWGFPAIDDVEWSRVLSKAVGRAFTDMIKAAMEYKADAYFNTGDDGIKYLEFELPFSESDGTIASWRVPVDKLLDFLITCAEYDGPDELNELRATLQSQIDKIDVVVRKLEEGTQNDA